MSTIGRIIDRTGEVHNGITFVKTTDSRAEDGAVVWELRCHCGAIFNRPAEKIIKGNTKSCGCTRYDKVKRAGEEATTRIHGESYSRLYGIWANDATKMQQSKPYFLSQLWWKRNRGL